MNFQTVFYHRPTGKILRIEPSKYVRSKAEKHRFVPDHNPDEVGFLYFSSKWQLDPAVNRVKCDNPRVPAQILDGDGIVLFLTERMLQFNKLAAQFDTFVLDMADSMGDQLLRVACVMEAQKRYPRIRFFCKVEPQYRGVLALCPDITLFTSYADLGIDPKTSAVLKLNGGHLYDPRGKGYNKACVYGTWLNLNFVPYNVRLELPPGFDQEFTDFDAAYALRPGTANVTFQLRSKQWEQKCVDVSTGVELARLLHQALDCNIYWVGTEIDAPGALPGIVNLCGKSTWLETVHLLTRSSHVFCIDSAVAHLCRALGKDCYRIWGLTHPQQIFGEDPTAFDITDSFEPGPSDIKAFTPAILFNRAFPRAPVTDIYAYDPANNTSQHGEQEIVFKWFREHPPAHRIVVDVGAYGKEMSNSFALLQLGWKGLLLEANPANAARLAADTAGFDAKVLSIAVADKAATMSLHLHSIAGQDSLDPLWFPDSATEDTIEVKAKPLHKILQAHAIPLDLDLLSIDTEGFDFRILVKLFEASDYRPRMIITECTSFQDPLAFFTPLGYTLLARTGGPEFGNLILTREP